MSLLETLRPTRNRIALVVVCALALGLALTWTYLSMRAVMDVGGACADGGPYVSAQPCPDGAVLIAFAIPLMIIAAMAGSAAALSLGAPNQLIPMWALLFGSLGWNFLDYGVLHGERVWGWIVCGVVFWIMAFPACYAIALGLKTTLFPVAGAPDVTAARMWWVLYPVLGTAGAALGVLTFNAFS